MYSGILAKITVAAAMFGAVACGKAAAPAARSPSHDYPAPTQETSQGEIVGADRMTPGDKMKTGASIGSGGVVPSERPSTSESGTTKHPSSQKQ